MKNNNFYDKMQPYFDVGIIREVYNDEYFSIISVGELCYVLCPKMFDKSEPYGLRLSPVNLRKVVKNNNFGLELFNLAFVEHERYGRLFAFFSKDKIDLWKKWIVDHQKLIKPTIDYNFEEEINTFKRNKSK